MKKILLLFVFILVCFAGCTMDVEETGVESDLTKPSDDKMQQDIVTQEDRVVIALLDTGVAKVAITGGHLLSGYNYVTNSDNTEDMMNHGTAVASVILGCESAGVKAAAQDAYIVPLVVVTKQDGEVVSVSPEILAKAVRDSVDIYGADIINISLGIEKDDPLLLQAVVYAGEKGVLVVSAAGNGGTQGKPYYPAAYDMVLAVGSCDKNGQESDFSQSGSDVLAMGEDIWLASKNGKTYGARGTSYATGFVSAVAADFLIKEPDLSLQELREKIIKKAADSGGFLH